MTQATGTSRNPICTLCQEEDAENDAVTWCSDCETFLCSSCNKTHGRIKSTKEHNTIYVENLHEMPTFITTVPVQCQKHGKRFVAYCSAHSVACCIECIISDHKTCEDVSEIADVLNNFKSSSSVFHVERNLSDLSQNFEIIDKYLETRLATISTQKTNCENQIIKEKKIITDHLDKIEKHSLDDLESRHSEIRSRTAELKKEVKQKKSKIDRLQTDLTKMKEFATELQMFVGIKEMEKLTTEQIKYIEDCNTKCLLDEHNLELDLCPLVKPLLSDLVTLCNVSVSVAKTSLQLKYTKGQQVSIANLVKPTVEQIKPTVKTIIKIPGNLSITGCQILPDGRMVFIDLARKCLLLFTKEGNYVRDVVTFPKQPCDVTYINDNIVAVASNMDKIIYFVDIANNKVIKSLNVNKTNISGIDNDNSKLRLTTGYDKVIVNLSYEGEILSQQSIASAAVYIASFEDKIYLSEYFDHNISCIENNGNMLWKFRLEKGRHPRGISVDKYGFVYVACNESNNIIAVSPDGKHSSIVFNQKDGLSNPTGLSIDRKSSTLLVANNTDDKGYLLQRY